MSDHVPMEHDSEPSGLPVVPAATPSVATRLSAHTAKRKWVLYSADRFVAQCHEVACETCNGYIYHLINDMESGAVLSMPLNLSKALNEAWSKGMWDIHEDARHGLCRELDSARHAYDEQKAQFNWLQLDYDALDNQLDDE